MNNKKPNIISLFRTFLYQRYGSAFAKEIILIFTFAISFYIYSIATQLDAFEILIDFVHQHEEYELDEVIFFILISSIAFIIIMIRNVKYLRIEVRLRSKSEKELNKMAFFDSLTGLPNRALCKNRLEQLVVHAKRSKKLGAVFFIDLDNFKDINDSLGHVWGDELLKKLAKRLKVQLRVDDTIGRISGDEFTVIIDDLTNTHSISLLAEKLIAGLNSPFILDNEEVYATMSIGIAVFPTDAKTANGLLKCADTAMYSAKHGGKGQYRFFSVELEKQAKYKLKISNFLRKAIDKNEFTLNYQPVIDVKTQKIKGAEALLRWYNKELGHVGPDVFIPIAEEIGLINEIGHCALVQACKQNKKWHLAGHSDLVISVNMSAKQLISDSYLTEVKEALALADLEGCYLELELTETTILGCVDMAIKQIHLLKKMGVAIALDDFGTGYSSMSYLVKLKIDRLKIDKSFIDNVPNSEDDVITTNAILSLAKNLNLQVTAEGIETKEQYDFLKSTSCNAIQGYYFSRPLSADDFTALLEKIEPITG